MKKTLLALALLGVSTAASADALIYGGASAGQSDINGNTDTSYNIHVGTGILPFIGLEVGYQDHGKFTTNYDNASRDFSAKSYYAAAKPSIDFGPLHVYAKAGVHQYELKGTNYSEKELSTLYGVGVEYFAMGPISLGASYMVYNLKHDDVKTLSLNASIHFL
ncbi:outer membrane beta-barrel protein [Vibrio sp.]|uniref:outer membrane beta-barrel protein n=1 Tax=Vibrio sp. TaxID=678 RepID=UPI003D0E5989